MPRLLTEVARAKINLTLHVVGRRPDGYHDIESLVVFGRQADRLMLTPGPSLDLAVSGPYAAQCGVLSENLVLKAARALARDIDGLRLGRFRLTKNLPVAAGIGGGSADAAAALRLLAKANKLRRDDPRLYAAALSTGADVPVCLRQQPAVMTGIGEELSAPVAVPKLHAVLVNPGAGLSTKDVFAAFDRHLEKSGHAPPTFPKSGKFTTAIANAGNDLEGAAISLRPVVADVLAALRAQPDCQLARMSGAGATCFGLFSSMHSAQTAARSLRARQREWWIRADNLGR